MQHLSRKVQQLAILTLLTLSHIEDKYFALSEGLLPPQDAKGKIHKQLFTMGEKAGISIKLIDKIFAELTSNVEEVKQLIHRSFLTEKFKRNYKQAYLTRL